MSATSSIVSRALILSAVLCSWFATGAAEAADDLVTSAEAQAAVERSLELLQHSTTIYRRERECFSCHHQALPVLAVQQAQVRGLAVDDENLRKQLEHTYQHLERGRKSYEAGRGQGGAADTAGYALWTLEVGQWPADDLTTAVVEYLLQRHQDKGHWATSSSRPPSEVSSFTTTFLAVRALQYYARPEQAGRVNQRVQEALEWVSNKEPDDTEDHVFRLWALEYLDGDRSLVEKTAEQLLAQQRSDGGWAQTNAMASDAYATGTVLVVLRDTGTCEVRDAHYQRGLRYLLETQQLDGSWHVVSRSKPFQTYLETGFPHGPDQFISAAATSWAMLALLEAVGPIERP